MLPGRAGERLILRPSGDVDARGAPYLSAAGHGMKDPLQLPVAIPALVVLIQFFRGRTSPRRDDCPSPDQRQLAIAANPCGWVGLVLSVLAIVVIAAAIVAGVVGLVFVAGLVTGGADRALAAVRALRHPADIVSYWRIRELYGVAIEGALGASVLVVARWRGGPRWRDLVAWRPFGVRRHAGSLAFALVLKIAIPALIVQMIGPLPRQWHPIPPEALALVLYLGVAVVLAPVAEELLFRGWLYTSLRPKLGAKPCILVTSVAFALFHWEPTHLYMILVLPGGLILAIMRERTGSTRATAGLHAAYNAAAFGLKVLASR